ncbi:MAG: DUF4114 domain-containing protein [Scytonema sp. PMC 1069.18]|nr:DUF4114 domain-containing protein [Scytonema sp. PMC 1069.18]MEC4884691.1 DUF4114 domain-containing protein [Scytonema sp. PMC 1070.18]
MKKNHLKKLLVAATTMAGVLASVAPASASTFTWGNWTKNYQVQDRLTDNTGFQSLIPKFQDYVQPEAISIPEDKLNKVDPTKLSLKADHNVRIWFLNEGAGSKNQLAYEAINGSDYTKGLLFDNISCDSSKSANSACQLGENSGVLDIGDYVELGKVSGGTQLNFFIKADGFNNPDGYVYGADASENPDKLEHLIAYEVDGYLLLGVEDLYGPEGATDAPNQNSDRDFNDIVFVVDFGKDNLASVPEPASVIALMSLGAVGMLKLRRRQNPA